MSNQFVVYLPKSDAHPPFVALAVQCVAELQCVRGACVRRERPLLAYARTAEMRAREIKGDQGISPLITGEVRRERPPSYARTAEKGMLLVAEKASIK